MNATSGADRQEPEMKEKPHSTDASNASTPGESTGRICLNIINS